MIALQEIKCLPDQFPRKEFEEMGFPHLHIVGQKGLHGVAIASRTPIGPLDQDKLCPRGEARFQRVRVNGVELQNYYILHVMFVPITFAFVQIVSNVFVV